MKSSANRVRINHYHSLLSGRIKIGSSAVQFLGGFEARKISFFAKALLGRIKNIQVLSVGLEAEHFPVPVVSMSAMFFVFTGKAAVRSRILNCPTRK